MSTPSYQPVGTTVTSGKLAEGHFAERLAGLFKGRRYLKIRNLSEFSLWWRIADTATVGPPSEEIPAGGVVEKRGDDCPPEDLSIIGVKTGQHYMMWEG